ncbi:MAG: 4Fe-4S dicluster domain-containing protein [Francisellaceae bacterium]
MEQYYFLAHHRLDDLIDVLKSMRYTIKAPVIKEATIVYDDIKTSAELPWGYVDIQEPAFYKVTKSDVDRAFAWSLPVQSIKPMLFKEKEVLWAVKRDDKGRLRFERHLDEGRYAVLGVRPCDLRAIAIQDRIFIGDQYADVRYQDRREKLFLIAVNCTDCHSNCFCVSMEGGPVADAGYDLAMTEIAGGFMIKSASDKGQSVLRQLNLPEASEIRITEAMKATDSVYDKQQKSIPSLTSVERDLKAQPDHPRWQEVSDRCLSCGSCTQACPTCFCHDEKEQPALEGDHSEHMRLWDSCFSLDHSYTHGDLYRENPKYRYRQWLTHKFSTWRDQFDTNGCVGCGRCITWCPVSIDVIEEINAICRDNKDTGDKS